MSAATQARAAALGDEAAQQLRARVAATLRERIGDRMGGITVSETEAGVVLSGRRLGRRFLDDDVVRWIAGVLR